MQLNDAQNKAVCHTTGPMMVLAGPGSGKTRVITERVKHLINENGAVPENILVVTFTRAAAMEMKQRYISDCSKKGVMFGTFHSIFFLILKYAYHYNSSDILKEEDKFRYIKSAISSLNIESENQNDLVASIISEIGRVKTERFDIENYYSLSCPAEDFQRIYSEYDKLLKKKRLIDFDDMMLYTYELFDARKDILKMWQKKFQYILVDEFQDINAIQYDIVRLLAGSENNLFIVGDDDQSIYSFRGSKPEIMLNFDKDFPDALKVTLNINYRSSANIIETASKLIAHNEVRFDKELIANKDAGESIDIQCFSGLLQENEAVVRQINDYHASGIDYSDIAVLYRTNNQPQALIHKLLEYNIPVKLKAGIPNIYDHWIAKDIFAYIRLALGARDRASFMQVMNRPKRYISRDCVNGQQVDFDELEAMYEDKRWMCERLWQFKSDLKAISRMTPVRGLRYIDKVIGYGDFLKEYAEWRNIPYENLRDVYEQICDLAAGFDKYYDWLDHVDEYAEWKKTNQKEESDAVVLMTLHGSKGLEYERVFITDVNEDIIPNKLSTQPEEIEEERRMFYVGMTRAKTKLHLFYVKNRYNCDLEPSRFLDELNN